MNRVIDQVFGWNWKFLYQKKEPPPAATVIVEACVAPVSRVLAGDGEEVCEIREL